MTKRLVWAAAIATGGMVSVATFFSGDPEEGEPIVVNRLATGPVPAAARPSPPSAPNVPEPDRRAESGDEAERAARVLAAREHLERARRAASSMQTVARGRVVDAVTSLPVAGAKITAAAAPVGEARTAPVESDADGHFELLATMSFLRAAFVEAEGYALARAPLTAGRDGDRRVFEAGEIRLHRGTRVSGRVLDASGAPVAGATLLLHDPPLLISSFLPADARAVGTTGAGGEFSVPAVPPSGEGGTRLFAVAASGVGRVDLDVLVGRETLPGVEVRLLPSTRLDVRVVDDAGAPVAGAVVEAIPLHETFLAEIFLRAWGNSGGRVLSGVWIGEDPSLRALLSATTDEKGRASLPRLPVGGEGAYAVQARAGGHVDAVQGDLVLRPSGSERVELRLLRAVSRRVPGIVVTEVGRPLPRARVLATVTPYPRLSVLRMEATTDAEGRFELTGAAPGETLWLSVEREGVARIATRLEIPADRDPEPVRIVAVPPEPITITVVDQTGLPVEGATGTLLQRSTFLSAWPRATASDGVLHFPDAASGSWRVSVSLPAPREAWRVARLTAEVRGGDAVRLEAVRVDPGIAEWILEVVDGATGLPVEPTGASVWMDELEDKIVQHRFRAETVERRVGEIRARPLAPGEWRARVEAAGGAASASVTVRPGDTVVRTRLSLAPPGRVAGRVVADVPLPAPLRLLADRPVLPLDATHRPTAATPEDTIEVGRDGTFLCSAAAGPLHLSVHADGWRGAQVVTVRSGEETACEIRLHRGAVLEVEGAERYADGRLVVLLSWDRGGEVPWIVRHEALSVESARRTVAPGRYTYEVRYGVPRGGRGGVELPVVARGVVEVEAGRVEVLRLP